MTKHMTSTPGQRVSKEDAEAFCNHCNWAYEVWVTHKCLFDDNPNREDNIGRVRDFTVRLSAITQEYGLLQIAKLHDPWRQGRHCNLSVDYMVRFGDWGARQGRINDISAKLAKLHEHIRPARDKILSHVDRATISSRRTLGAFPRGEDDQYFAALQDLANEVHLHWTGKLFPFDDLACSDAREFLHVLASAPRRGVR